MLSLSCHDYQIYQVYSLSSILSYISTEMRKTGHYQMMYTERYVSTNERITLLFYDQFSKRHRWQGELRL